MSWEPRAKNPAARQPGWRSGRRWVRWAGAALLVGLLLAGAGWLALPLVALPAGLFRPELAQVELLDRHGQPLRAVRPTESAFRQPVPYGQIPQCLVQATLAAEDRRFWSHPGVDWRSSLRAAWQWAWNRRIISGGSTITQQLIKLAQPRRRTLATKLIEALQALRLEQLWDKQRILAEYLNRIDYGNFNAGCAVAARFYFAKPLADLSPAECALLAGLPQAPSRLNPLKHPERALKRQQWILKQMNQWGFLQAPAYQRALQEPLRLAQPQRVFQAPHFVELLLQQNGAQAPPSPSKEDDLPEPSVWPEGFAGRVQTTLDLELNRFAEQTVRLHLARLQAQQVRDAAVVVLDNRSGEVLALVGSQDYFAPLNGQVNGAWAPRSAGSTFKPFTYLLAFEQGATPASVVADVPTEFATATGLFAPVNFNHHCYGPMRYRMALANSLNISAVKVLASVGGAGPLCERLKACGLSTLSGSADFYGLGLTIGNAEARLLELANAYACLARLGQFKPWRLLPGPASQPSGLSRQVAQPQAAYLVADILSDNSARSLAFGAESALRFDFPVACKTGTSSDFRDNWAFGFTPEFTVGVWVGNFDGSPMRQVSGVTGAAPILHSLFEQLHSRFGTSWFARPAGLSEAWVHELTGKRVPQASPGEVAAEGLVRETFLASHLPELQSPADFDSAGRVPLGAEYRDWLAGADNWLGGRAVLAAAESSPRIVFPLPGTILYLDPDLPQQGRRLLLRAEGVGQAQWRSDSLECRQEGAQCIALLSPGKHRLGLRDSATGVEVSTWIEVKQR